MNTLQIDNALELLENEEYGPAKVALKGILEENPNSLSALLGLGDLFFATSDYENAEKTYKKIIELAADNSDALFGLGATLRVVERYSEAIDYYEQAFTLEPERTDAYWEVAYSKEMVGDLSGAERDYKRCLLDNPNNSMAQHLLAALTGNNTEKAPPRYVSDLFDDYASVFDAELVDELSYNVPQQIEREIKNVLIKEKAKQSLLDLGCGTGLVGESLYSLVQDADGVDLSPKMLEVARAKKVYNGLYETDFEEFLFNTDLGKQEYNIVVSGDALVYCGRLDKVFLGVAKRLATAGGFCFILEDNKNLDYQLQRSGRYSHSSNYINKTLTASGFVPTIEKSIVPRTDGEDDIIGKLYLCRKQ